MSRYTEHDGEERFAGQTFLWEANARRALKGKRGRRALTDLRAALLALPEKRLISRALCTVGVEPPADVPDDGSVAWMDAEDLRDLLESQGSGVCAIGAYIWWRHVKAGKSPEEAFAALPLLDDIDHDIEDTAAAGVAVGLALPLAWELAYRNDETYDGLTPEERYVRFLAWIDAELAEPVAVIA